MPNAAPETTVKPRSPSPAAISVATISPYAVALRAPTTATDRAHTSASRTSPRTHRQCGGQSRSSSPVGHSSSSGTDHPGAETPGHLEVLVDVELLQPGQEPGEPGMGGRGDVGQRLHGPACRHEPRSRRCHPARRCGSTPPGARDGTVGSGDRNVVVMRPPPTGRAA